MVEFVDETQRRIPISLDNENGVNPSIRNTGLPIIVETEGEQTNGAVFDHIALVAYPPYGLPRRPVLKVAVFVVMLSQLMEHNVD